MTQPALGRSRTTMTVASGVRSARLREAALRSAALEEVGINVPERRANADGVDESRPRGGSAWRLGGTVLMRPQTKGGGLTEGRRVDAAPGAPRTEGSGSGGGRGGRDGTGAVEAVRRAPVGAAARRCDDEEASRVPAIVARPRESRGTRSRRSRRHSPATSSSTRSSRRRREPVALTLRGSRAGLAPPRGEARGEAREAGERGSAGGGGAPPTRMRSSSSSSISSPAFFRFENGSKSPQLPLYPCPP